MELQTLLAEMVERKASDLHLCVGVPPILRVDGSLTPRNGKGIGNLEAAALEMLLRPAISDEQIDAVKARQTVTATVEHDGQTFRALVYQGRGHLAASFRRMPHKLPSLEELDLPPILEQLTHKKRGLILLAGPTGSGKSTTMMAMLEHLNMSRSERIVAVESSASYVFQSRQSLVTRQIVGQDVDSYEQGLEAARHADADVLLIGDMRTAETVRLALEFAASGCLVFSQVTEASVSDAVQSLIDLSPASPDIAGRALARSFEAIIAQKLLPRADRSGRVPVNEILLATPAAREAIAVGQADLIPIMAGNTKMGMQTMDDALLKLYRAGTITYETAQGVMRDKGRLAKE